MLFFNEKQKIQKYQKPHDKKKKSKQKDIYLEEDCFSKIKSWLKSLEPEALYRVFSF